ncbi:unnamed protein product [Echinostoma caproni]|uniref:Peptidase A1 domain-containing protein n=1 Tax=Echinostoma caproni TaxID=27848 RepID=A0A183AWJ4_9TREM|nr:unnamed protein product [Echinostoma caproni]
MNPDIIKLLLITFCISGIGAENCEEVTASVDAKSFVVKSNVTGCQYRVKSDSGKAVKVYVNDTSGTNCVKVTIGGQTDTLCPKSSTTAFSSTSAIDVSADSVTTTTATTTVTPTTTKASSPPASASEGENKGNSKDTSKGNGAVSQEGDNDGKEKSKKEKKAIMEMSKMGVPVAGANRLMRQARDASTTAGSDDVTVYYVLDAVGFGDDVVVYDTVLAAPAVVIVTDSSLTWIRELDVNSFFLPFGQSVSDSSPLATFAQLVPLVDWKAIKILTVKRSAFKTSQSV